MLYISTEGKLNGRKMNRRKFFRVEHKTIVPHWIINANANAAANHSVKAGIYSSFFPWKLRDNVVYPERNEQLIEKYKDLYETLTALEDESDFETEKSQKIQAILERVLAKVRNKEIPYYTPRVHWNLRRPNALCDPFLREVYLKNNQNGKLPIYGFDSVEQLLSWFSKDVMEQILRCEDFHVVKYYSSAVYSGLRQSIVYDVLSREESFLF